MNIIRMDTRHRAFCARSWLSSYWASARHGMRTGEAYYNRHIPVVDQLLDTERTWVATNPEDSDQILGWCCVRLDPLEHGLLYVYVKQLFRARTLDERGQPVLRVAEGLLRHAGQWPVGRDVVHVGRFVTPGWEAYARKYGLEYVQDAEHRVTERPGG